MSASADDFFDDRGALRLLVNMSDVAETKLELATFRDGHIQLHRRLQALLRLGPEMAQARQDLGPIRDDLTALEDRIDALEQEMVGTQGRLSLMASMPGWVAQLGMIRGAMNAKIGPEVQDALGAGQQLALFTTEFVELVDYLDHPEVSLLRSSLPPAGTERNGRGEVLLHKFERALTGQSEEDSLREGLAGDLRRWLVDLHETRRQINRMASALSQVPLTSHPIVDGIDDYISSYAPALDGLQWIIDSGRWSWAVDLNADLLTSAGVLAHQMRTLIFGELKVPEAQNLVQSALDWMEQQHRNLLSDLDVIDSNWRLQEDMIDQNQMRLQTIQESLGTLAVSFDQVEEVARRELEAASDAEVTDDLVQTLA